MANKTTRKLRKQIARASRRGEDTVEHMTPVPDYHNHSNDEYRARPTSLMVRQVFPTATVKGDGVNSANKRRNSCQRVYTNMGENRRSTSLTCHEPFLRNEPMRGKGHGYIEYRRGNVSA